MKAQHVSNRGRTVMFDPYSGVVVDIAMGTPIDMPYPGRNFLNSSEPGPVMRNLAADIMPRQYGQLTLLRDQKRAIDRAPHTPPANYQRADFADRDITYEPYIGVVELP